VEVAPAGTAAPLADGNPRATTVFVTADRTGDRPYLDPEGLSDAHSKPVTYV